MSSIRDRWPISALSTRFPDSPVMTRQNGTIDVSGLGEIGTQGLYKATLYVLGEKTQMKVSVCFCLNQMPGLMVMEIHAPTISLDSHQNIRLHTGARVNVVLLTYLCKTINKWYCMLLERVHLAYWTVQLQCRKQWHREFAGHQYACVGHWLSVLNSHLCSCRQATEPDIQIFKFIWIISNNSSFVCYSSPLPIISTRPPLTVCY